MLRFLRLQEQNQLEEVVEAEVVITAPTQVVVTEKGVILVLVEIEKEVDLLEILLQEKKVEEEVEAVAQALLKKDLMLPQKEKELTNFFSCNKIF
jgi:hypothetical protein